MSDVEIIPGDRFDRRFIPDRFLPDGKGQYYLRDEQCGRAADTWRSLRPDEIDTLREGGNTAEDWDAVLVTDPFDPILIRNCELCGLVRIGRLTGAVLRCDDIDVPAGITGSRVIDCDIGDDVAIHNVRYLSHYIVGDNCMLLNIDEMHCTSVAKFGNGIVSDGEDEGQRKWLEVINEAPARRVTAFDGMTPGDAWLWAGTPEDTRLTERLIEITQKQFDPRRGHYGTVGDGCVIKSCRIIKDVKFGPAARIEGASKLDNLTINSSPREPSLIGDGVSLVDGIVGLGCRVSYGSVADRFVLGSNCALEYGARLIHSVLGDNSVVACCEIRNSLIFPFHGQHHNSSFLISSLVMGQSNLAAGATIGSNHNGREHDGELHAGRGFWPGLCVSLKHNSRFASFCLLAKGDYPHELNVPLPFALVSNDAAGDRLIVMPAYWWLYNMYGLARNTWKLRGRDKRKVPTQRIEYDCLAPDTAEEIFAALDLLQRWASEADLHQADPSGPDLDVLAEGIENSRRDVLIVKARRAWHAYREMLHYYAAGNLVEYMTARRDATLASMCEELAGDRQKQWVNLGGQIVTADDLQAIGADISSGKLDSWDDIHDAYDRLWQAYPLDKSRHAFASLLAVLDTETLTGELWRAALDRFLKIQQYVADQVYLTRKKDDDNPFRQMTYDSPEQMHAALGTAEDNTFINHVRAQTAEMAKTVEQIKTRG